MDIIWPCNRNVMQKDILLPYTRVTIRYAYSSPLLRITSVLLWIHYGMCCNILFKYSSIANNYSRYTKLETNIYNSLQLDDVILKKQLDAKG